MSTIYESQNEERHIQQLAAQRQLYHDGKQLQWYLFLLAVPISMVVSIIANIFPDLQTVAAVWGAAIVILELWASSRESSKRIKGAKIQELFDCEVLQLPWNDVKSRGKPDRDDIRHYSQKHLAVSGNREKLLNWYFEEPDCLPLRFSRIIAQRSNLSWDSRLRERFSSTLKTGLISLGILIIIVALIRELTIKELLLRLVLPLLPVFFWSLPRIRTNRLAARNLEELKKLLDQKWEAVFTGKISPDLLDETSRKLQDEIYQGRAHSPLIPERIYHYFLPRDQEDMYRTADQLCREAKELLNQHGVDIP